MRSGISIQKINPLEKILRLPYSSLYELREGEVSMTQRVGMAFISDFLAGAFIHGESMRRKANGKTPWN